MSWVKVDDNFDDHPKFLELSDAGLALWLRALAHANKHMTDGHVPIAFVRRRGKTKTARELVEAGLWEESRGGYVIHDYLKLNDSREVRLRKLDEARDRKERFKARKRVPGHEGNASGTRSEHVPNSVPNASPSRPRNALPTPLLSDATPTLEDPPVVPQGTEPEVSTKNAKPKRAKPRTSCPPGDTPADQVNRWLVDRKVPRLDDPEFGTEVAKMLDHHRAHGKLSADWAASWRTWRGNIRRFGPGRPAGGPPRQQELSEPLWKPGEVIR